MVQVSPSGVLSFIQPGTSFALSRLFLLIPKPGWQGQWFSQESWQPDQVEVAPGGGKWRLVGQARWEGGGLEIEERVSLEGQALHLSYRCRSLGETPSEGVRLIIRAPVASLAGRGQFLTGLDGVALSYPLPAELPDPYHLTSASRFTWLAWQRGEEVIVLRPVGEWSEGMFLQDDRKFNMPEFEVQIPLVGTQRLQRGQEFGCQLVIAPRTLAALRQQGVVIVPGKDRWESARVPLASAGELKIGEIEWSARQGPRWRPVELRFSVSGTWQNPFDPQDIAVEAVIAGPDGRSRRQPAFVYQDFEPLTPGGELLKPRGALHWRVRWTPLQEGKYRLTLTAVKAGRQVSRPAGEFVCRGSAGSGFIRRCAHTPYYLCFDDGSPYFAIGENICWDGEGLLEAYRRWFKRLGQAGGNYCRIWLVRWNMGLEWSAQDPARRGCFYGLGRYSLDNAWRLDQVLQAAAENGIYVMLCLGYHGELMDQPDYFGSQCWQFNPYNAALGGPCQKPADFWTDPQARELYKRRLRYCLARWGAYPNVLSWEFWNEVYAPADWIREMAAYLGEHDLHHHLRTTTYGRDDVWQLEEMDYSQAHHYGSDENLLDSAPIIAATSLEFTERYRKPFLMGEFGIDWKRTDAAHDPRGAATNFHNGLWAALASRSLGCAALWYWEDYVDRLGLYDQFTKVARFVRLVDWTRFNPRPLEAEPVRLAAPAAQAWGPLQVALAEEWRRQPEGEIRLRHDGRFVPGPPAQFLFSAGKKDLQSPIRLRLDMPQEGTVTFVVGRVSASARLVIKLDGEQVAERTYQCGPPGQGPYKDSKYYEQWKIWQATFDDQVQVQVPAGSHLLELSNEAGDWLTIPRLVVSHYRDMSLAPVDVYLLADERLLVGWVHDQESNWQNDRDGKIPPARGPLRLAFSGLRDGSYEILWYDTWQGQFAPAQRLMVRGGRVELLTPVFKRDVALLIRPR
jgi:hypothetical protein